MPERLGGERHDLVAGAGREGLDLGGREAVRETTGRRETSRTGEARNFCRADAAHGSLWRNLYSRLPVAWKARELVYVREVTDDDMDRFVERFEGPNSKDNSIVDGCYQANRASDDTAGQITLRQSLRGENAALVFVHEYGHYVWSSVLTNGDRARYHRVWREQKRTRNLVTEYAGDSDEEGFAEAFAYFIRKPGILRRLDSRSSTFMTEMQDALAGDFQSENRPQ